MCIPDNTPKCHCSKRPKRAWIHLWKSHHLCCRISLKYVSFSSVTVLISNCSYTLVGDINVHFHVSSYTYVLKNNIVMPGVEGLIDWFTMKIHTIEHGLACQTLHDLTSASLHAVSAPVSNSFVLFTSLVLEMCLVLLSAGLARVLLCAWHSPPTKFPSWVRCLVS